MLRKAWKEQLNCNLGKLAICPGLEDQECLAVGRTIVCTNWVSFQQKKTSFGFMSLINFDTFFYTCERVKREILSI